MNPVLATFLISLLSIGLLLWLFLRDAVNNIKNIIAEHAKIYAVAYVKGGCLIYIASGTTFKEVFQPVTAEMADKFTWWDWFIHFNAPILAGMAVLAAFLDQTKQRADAVKAAKEASAGPSAPPFPIKPPETTVQ